MTLRRVLSGASGRCSVLHSSAKFPDASAIRPGDYRRFGLCTPGQLAVPCPQYAASMIPTKPTTTDRRARIEQMIEDYRRAKQRRLMRRAIALWRKTEARQQVA